MSDVDRYEKLMKRAVDPTSTAAERATATAAAKKLAAESDEVRRWQAFKAQGSTPPPKPRARPSAAAAWSVLLPVASAAVDEVLRQAPGVTRAVVSHYAGKLSQALEPNRAAPSPPPTPSTEDATMADEPLSTLLDRVDAAGRVLTDDADAADVLVLVLTLPADVAVELAHRLDDGARKVAPRLGDLVAEALHATATSETGEYGDWPFADDDTDAE